MVTAIPTVEFRFSVGDAFHRAAGLGVWLLGADDRRAVAEEADVRRDAGLGALDLSRTRLTAQLPGELADLRERLCGHGFAETGQAAARRRCERSPQEGGHPPLR